MPAFKVSLFPFGRFLASPADRAAGAAPGAPPPRRPRFLLVLLRALSAWGV